jgi:hypothetical protein
MKLSHRRRTHKKGATARLAARLAPLEELDKKSAAKQLGATAAPELTAESGFSAIVVDNNNLQVPKEILEEGGEQTYMGMEPVVIVILAFMIVFIAFIAWQISIMPAE